MTYGHNSRLRLPTLKVSLCQLVVLLNLIMICPLPHKRAINDETYDSKAQSGIQYFNVITLLPRETCSVSGLKIGCTFNNLNSKYPVSRKSVCRIKKLWVSNIYINKYVFEDLQVQSSASTRKTTFPFKQGVCFNCESYWCLTRLSNIA